MFGRAESIDYPVPVAAIRIIRREAGGFPYQIVRAKMRGKNGVASIYLTFVPELMRKGDGAAAPHRV
jgi:hypothetical protein